MTHIRGGWYKQSWESLKTFTYSYQILSDNLKGKLIKYDFEDSEFVLFILHFSVTVTSSFWSRLGGEGFIRASIYHEQIWV